MNIVKADQFNISKFTIPPESKYSGIGAYQHSLYPRYEYPLGGKSDCLILTDRIKLTRGGIQKNDQKYEGINKTDESFMSIKLCSDSPGVSELIEKVCVPIDNLFKKLNNIMITKNNGEQAPLQKLKYCPIVQQTFYNNHGGDDDDNIIKNNSFKRITIKLKKQKDKITNTTNVITKIFIPENQYAPINERVFKTVPEDVKCLDDVRKLVSWNSTIRMIFKVHKFWANKIPQNEKLCGIVLLCEQIYVIDNPTWLNALKFDPNKVPVGLGLITSDSVTKNDVANDVADVAPKSHVKKEIDDFSDCEDEEYLDEKVSYKSKLSKK